MMNFVFKTEELCIKNEEFCSKNDEFCSEVEVRFATYNGNSKLFSIVHMRMKFSLSGQTMKYLNVDSINLELTGSNEDYIRHGLELIILLFTGLTMMTEMMEVIEEGFGYFEDSWNYVDLMNIWLYFWSATVWLYLLVASLYVEIPNKCQYTQAIPTTSDSQGHL